MYELKSPLPKYDYRGFFGIDPKTTNKPHPPRGAKKTLKWIINCKYSGYLKEDIETNGNFTRNSNIIEDLTLLSKLSIPKEIQKEIMILILPKYLLTLSEKDVEKVFESIDSLGPSLRCKIFSRIMGLFFNKKIRKGPHIKFTNIVLTFEKQKIIKALSDFEKLYCGNSKSFDKAFTNIFNTALILNFKKFEENLLKLINLSLKLGKSSKKRSIEKSAEILGLIGFIMSEHEGDEDLFKKLINYTVKNSSENNIVENFKELSKESDIKSLKKKLKNQNL